MSKKPLIFFGNERLASGVTTSAPLLRGLIESGYPIAAVIVNQSAITRRGQRMLEVEDVAREHDIDVRKISEGGAGQLRDMVAEYEASIGVLAAFGRLIPQDVIGLFPYGIVNIHPSLLPHYRGSTPIESAILNGDARTGVSLMKLVKEMDAGPVFGFAELELRGNESKQELHDSLAELGAHLLIEQLPRILHRSAVEAEQDHDAASYCGTIEKTSGEIDWTKPAMQLEREIRAYLGWPSSYTVLAGTKVTITAARVADATGEAGTMTIEDKLLRVYCGEGALTIDYLKPAGKKEMDGQSFINGYQNRLDLTDQQQKR